MKFQLKKWNGDNPIAPSPDLKQACAMFQDIKKNTLVKDGL